MEKLIRILKKIVLKHPDVCENIAEHSGWFKFKPTFTETTKNECHGNVRNNIILEKSSNTW